MESKQVTRRQALARGGSAGAGLLGLSAFLAACGGGTSPTTSASGGAAAKGGTAVWALGADPTYLIPFGGVPPENHQANEFMYDSLLSWDQKLAIQPALATSYSTPDATTYEFKLRKGVTFHDGTPLTAKDVVYSFKLQADPPPPGDPTALSQFPLVDHAEAVDDHTVRIHMKKPDARLLGYLAWGRYSSIVPEGMYDKLDPRTHGIGTGPFKLVSYRQNDSVVYERNPHFWTPGVPSLDGLTLKIMADEQARVAAVRSGQIHGGSVSSDIAKTLAGDPDVAVLKGLIASHREIQFTVKPGPKKPWHDKRVRQAVKFAIDRAQVIATVYSGNAEISSVVAPGYGDWPLSAQELSGTYLKHDVAQSRRLLAEAGYAQGFSAELQVLTATPDMIQIAQLVQQQLKQVGIDLQLRPLEVATFSRNNGTGAYDMQLTARGMRGDISGFFTDFDPQQPSYRVWFPAAKDIDPQIAKLIHQGISTVDTAARKPIYTQLQQLVLDEALHVPICDPYVFQVVSKKLQGMYVSYTGFNPGLRTARLTA